MKNGKDINLLIREALLRRKEGRPEVMLPEGFEDKVMEQIKAMPQLPSGKKEPTTLKRATMLLLRASCAAAMIAGVFYLTQQLTHEEKEKHPQIAIKTQQQKPSTPTAKEEEAEPQPTDKAPSNMLEKRVAIRKKPQPQLQATETTEISTSLQEASRRMESLRKQHESQDANTLNLKEVHPSIADNTSLLAMQKMIQNMNNFKKQYEP